MKKKQLQKDDDGNLYSPLKAIQKDINTLKNDVKMIKVDYVLKDSQLGLSLRGLTREIDQTNKEAKKLQSDIDNLVAQVVKLDGKIEDTAQTVHDEARQYHDSLATKLDFILFLPTDKQIMGNASRNLKPPSWASLPNSQTIDKLHALSNNISSMHKNLLLIVCMVVIVDD